MAASVLLLRSIRRRELLNSSLVAHKALAGNIESAAYPSNATLARLFSSKPAGNEVIPDKEQKLVKKEADSYLQKDQDQVSKALIGIRVTSFDPRFIGLPPHTRKVGLPESRVLYTVLRSPHIDKKSREQFEMRIKKLYLVIKTDRRELRNKFFWLKRQRIIGAQFEVNISCKTRLDKGRLDGLLGRSLPALTTQD